MFVSYLCWLSVVAALSVTAQKCTITDETDHEITWGLSSVTAVPEFKKDYTGLLFKIKLNDGIKYSSASSNYPCDLKYFQIEDDDNEVSFESTALPTEWDKVFASDSSNPASCFLSLTFDTSACAVAVPIPQIKLEFSITDVNLVDPKFDKDAYTLQVPFPLGTGIQLDVLSGTQIIASDTDFSTSQLTFSLDGPSEDFEIVYAGTHSNKAFPAHFSTKKLVFLDGPVELNATVTDDAPDGPRSGHVTITVQPSATSPPKQPEFEDALNRVAKGGEATLKLVGTYIGVLTVRVDNAKFTAIVQTTGNEATIQVSLLPDETLDGPETVLVQVDNTRDGKVTTGSTVVLFEFDGTTSSSTSSSSTSSSSTSSSSTTSSTSSTTSTTEKPGEDPDHTSTTTKPAESDDGDEETGLLVATIILAVLSACLLALVLFGYKKYVHNRTARNQAASHFGSETTDIARNNSTVSPTSTAVIESEKLPVTHEKEEKTLEEKLAALEEASDVDESTEIEKIDTEENSLKPAEDRSRKRSIKFSTTIEEVPDVDDSAELDKIDIEYNSFKPSDDRSRKRSITFSEDDGKAREFRETGKIPETESSSNGTVSSRNGSTTSDQPDQDNSEITNF